MAIIHKDLHFVHRTIVIASLFFLCACWSVYVPKKMTEALPPEYTWFKIIATPLTLCYILLSITLVPSLGIQLGVSGRSRRGISLFIAYFVPPITLLAASSGLT